MCGDNITKHGESVKCAISFRPKVETEHTNSQATIYTLVYMYKMGEATKQLWNRSRMKTMKGDKDQGNEIVTVFLFAAEGNS
jgi:hypothetical protein